VRKSTPQRISDTEAAIAQWTAAGLQADKRVSFMRDALARLGRGKGLTPKQREWLDTLCAEGPPAPKGDPALLARIARAGAHLDTRGREALESMRSTITRGWKLSDKQAAFLTKLLDEAERIATHGRWKPSPEKRAVGLFAAKVVDSRSSAWKANHPGTVTAANRILSGAVEADEWTYNKVIGSVGPAVREYNKPKFAEGELVWITTSWGAAVAGLPPGYDCLPAGTMALVTGGPVAILGDVGYPVLAGNVAVVVNSKVLSRRNPTGLI
jgi:hypothetical protein